MGAGEVSQSKPQTKTSSIILFSSIAGAELYSSLGINLCVDYTSITNTVLPRQIVVFDR